MLISQKELKRFTESTINAPHDYLGMHPAKVGGKQGLVVRAFLSQADACEVVDLTTEEDLRFELKKIDDLGFFEGFIEGRKEVFPYRLRVRQKNQERRQFYDPYSFLPSISESDLYLFNEGTERRIYEKLGAHPMEMDGVPGVSFAVWAPSAQRVSVVGSFNRWDGRYHPMRSLGSSGVWEIFIPGMQLGEMYKFEVKAQNGAVFLKTDPYGSYFEAPPNNASIVYDNHSYGWNDAEWMETRGEKQ